VRVLFGVLLFAFVLLRQYEDGATAAELGLAWQTFLPALRQLALPTALACMALLAMGLLTDSLRLPNNPAHKWLLLPVWPFLPQLLPTLRLVLQLSRLQRASVQNNLGLDQQLPHLLQ
jgi:hypothetical protein